MVPVSQFTRAAERRETGFDLDGFLAATTSQLMRHGSSVSTLQQLSVEASDLTLVVSRLSVLLWRVLAFLAQADLPIFELSAPVFPLAIQLRAYHFCDHLMLCRWLAICNLDLMRHGHG